MGGRVAFDPKYVSEDKILTVDFASDIGAPGVTILDKSVTISVYSGTDATPSNMLSGNPTVSGTTVSQKFVDGTAGVTYLTVWSATTSDGQVLMRIGYLVVESG